MSASFKVITAISLSKQGRGMQETKHLQVFRVLLISDRHDPFPVFSCN